jgi:hypothetical protein
MSYDLFFAAGPGKQLDQRVFAAYFRDRRHYEMGRGQALYHNDDTGVYFLFEEPENGTVAFNLNYFRPHVFGLEAVKELEAFAEAFGAQMTDPQGEMANGGPFAREAFLKGWNAGNLFACQAKLKDHSGPLCTWPAKQIREVWEWNYARPPQQTDLGDGPFVPGIFAVRADGELQSMAIWPPDCAILMPSVDALLVPLAQDGEESEKLAIVKWNEVLPVVEPYRENGAGLPRYRLCFAQWPKAVAEFLGRRRPAIVSLDGVSLDQVLDRELVEEAGRA